jgi:hypothetical protein
VGTCSGRRLVRMMVSAVLAGIFVTVSALSMSQATASSSAPLSATRLHALVVAPPPPFDPLPDIVLKTGLMEFGNPKSGKIGTVVSIAQLKKAKFQRGWESAFRSADSASVLVDVFECATASDATKLARAAQARIPSTYTPTAMDGLAGVSAFAGVSPEGRTVNAAVYSQGRFFVFQDVGGTPGAHDYAALLTNLVRRQTALLPAT